MISMATLIAVILAGLAAWWLSGFASRVSGQTKESDLRRLLRLGVTLLLVGFAVPSLLRWYRYHDQVSGWLYLATTLPLAILWTGTFSTIFAHAFHLLIDPEDDRDYDPGKTTRDLDQVSRLVHAGQRDEAVALCRKLVEAGEASALAMETMLARLDAAPAAKPAAPTATRTLAEADRHIARGQFGEAEALLRQLLDQQPGHQAGTLMLARLYTLHLRQPAKAMEQLRRLEQQPDVPKAFLEYAHRSFAEWSCPPAAGESMPPAGEPPVVSPETPPPAQASVEDLLAGGYLGTAIELLERQIQAEPNRFELRLKLLEAHAVHCGNFNRADTLLNRLRHHSSFTPAQIQTARAQLQQWREQQQKPA